MELFDGQEIYNKEQEVKKLAIITPFRQREDHLKVFAPVLKQFGHIYIIEQMDNRPFNRAKLINIGYIEFKKEFDYFAAHDVDMIPEKVDYSHCKNPCHLATMVEQFGYNMPYARFFGGVTLFPNNKFEKVNGFSNEFFSWSAEDDHLRRKFEEKYIPIESRQCRFSSLPHIRVVDQQMRAKNLARLKAPIDWDDGLSSCRYEIVHCEEKENYTLLQVRL